jgi:hypothetical protein
MGAVRAALMLKIVSLFLIFMVVLAMFGRLRLPGIGRKGGGSLPKPRLCPDCGRYNLRGGRCRQCRNDNG